MGAQAIVTRNRRDFRRAELRFENLAVLMLAEYDAETRFRARAARGAGKAPHGLELLAKARGERRARRSG